MTNDRTCDVGGGAEWKWTLIVDFVVGGTGVRPSGTETRLSRGSRGNMDVSYAISPILLAMHLLIFCVCKGTGSSTDWQKAGADVVGSDGGRLMTISSKLTRGRRGGGCGIAAERITSLFDFTSARIGASSSRLGEWN